MMPTSKVQVMFNRANMAQLTNSYHKIIKTDIQTANTRYFHYIINYNEDQHRLDSINL